MEHNLTKAEIERDKQIKSSHNMKERLKDIERDRKEVLDEYISLKTNYLAMTKEIKNMVKIIVTQDNVKIESGSHLSTLTVERQTYNDQIYTNNKM